METGNIVVTTMIFSLVILILGLVSAAPRPKEEKLPFLQAHDYKYGVADDYYRKSEKVEYSNVQGSFKV